MTCPNCHPATTADKIAVIKKNLEIGPWSWVELFKKMIEVIEELEKREKRSNFIPLTVPNGGLPTSWPNTTPFPQQPPYQQPTTVPYPTPSYPIITCINANDRTETVTAKSGSIPDATGVSDETPGHFE